MATKPYTPKWQGNREKAERDTDYKPIIFHLKEPTESDLDIIDAAGILGVDDAVGASGSEMRKSICTARIIRTMVSLAVKKIENLKTDSGEAVTTGTDFVEKRSEIKNSRALYNEVFQFIEHGVSISEEEVKNLNAPSAQSKADALPDGAVTDAPKPTENTETVTESQTQNSKP